MGITLREIVVRHRRRHRRRPAVQGGPDRRPVRRLHPRRVPRHAGRLRVADRRRLDHGLGRHDRHGRHVAAWSTWRKYFMDFCREESCGKCVPCRVGTAQMLDAARPDHATARRPLADLDQLERLARHGPAAPACAASARAPRTRSSARCATSATSTWRTSSTGVCPAGVCTIGSVQASAGMSVHTLADRRHRRRRQPTGRPILDVATRERHRRSRRCATSTACPTSAPAACAWSRSTGSTKLLPACTTAVEEGMEVDDRLRAARRATAARSSRCCSPSATTSARCASPTTTASCRTWPKTCGVDHFELPVINPQVGDRRQPPAVRASTTTAASCAPAACGSATRSRARTPGTSWAAASTRGSSPTWARRGASRRPAPAAASASRSARPARCSRRAARSPRAARQRRPFLPYLAGRRRGEDQR